MREAAATAADGERDRNDLLGRGRVAPEHRYQVWPMVQMPDGEYSIPDNVLLAIWEDMTRHGRERIVFASGEVKTASEWLDWMKSKSNFPVVVVDAQERIPVFVAAINSFAGRICFAHFCGIGDRYRPEIAEKVMRFWDTFRDGQGRPFLAILAMIPETNKSAIRLAELAGFTFLVGSIPGLCDLVYEGKQVGGRVGYYCPPQEG